MVAWRYEISLLMLKKIFHAFAALACEMFFNTRRNFVSPRGHVISSMSLTLLSPKSAQNINVSQKYQ